MEKLLFVCKWDKDKKRTWSGTPYSLRESLKKFYDIVDCEIQLNFFQKVIAKLLSYRIHHGKIISLSYIFNPYYMKVLRRKAKKAINKFDGKFVLEIGDYYADDFHNISVYQDLSISYILHLRDNLPEIYKYCGHVYPKKYLNKRNNKQLEFYEKCDNIFVMGKWLEDFLSGNYQEKLSYIGAGYNARGTDTSPIELTQKSRNKILFVGRDFVRKGGDIVLSAFEKARAVKPDLELFIAGVDNISMNIDGVTVLGDVPNSELWRYYNKCDVLCVPSRFEAFGIVFVEALHFGLPVLASDAFEMREIVHDGENGYLLKNSDADELSVLMLKVLDNEKIFENVLNSRDDLDNKYSWDSVARRIWERLSLTC